MQGYRKMRKKKEKSCQYPFGITDWCGTCVLLSGAGFVPGPSSDTQVPKVVGSGISPGGKRSILHTGRAKIRMSAPGYGCRGRKLITRSCKSETESDDYYLSHDIEKESNLYGAIYIEKINSKAFTDRIP